MTTALPSEPTGSEVRCRNLRELIDRRAEQQPETVFLLRPENGRRVTYAGLRDAAAEISRRLAGCGIAPGESVAYALGNGYGAAIALLGCLYGGYRATAVNLAAGPDSIAYVLKHSEARLIFLGDEQRALVEPALAGLDTAPLIVPCDIDAGPLWPEEFSEGQLPAEPAASADGLLMYTSGTTGRPKGVLLSQTNLLAGGDNTAAAHGLTEADRALCVLPLYHINGLCVTLLGPLVSGGSLVMPNRFSASRFWGQALEGEVTWFSAVPTLFSYLLRLPAEATPSRPALARLRFGRSASAPLAPETHRAFEARYGLPVIETMGLTETAAPILSNPLPPGTRKPGSPGVACGNEVIIADKNQKEVKRGAAGEVLVRGPNVMRGYFKDPGATAAALTADGWLRTGDLGCMDEEGYVFVSGRLKELIIKGGENIAPREIDEALYGHPAVLEAAAFARPCADYGQRVEACVALEPGTEVSEAELRQLCIARLGDFKAPERIHFLDQLPKGPSGKIQRLKLAGLLDQS